MAIVVEVVLHCSTQKIKRRTDHRQTNSASLHRASSQKQTTASMSTSNDTTVAAAAAAVAESTPRLFMHVQYKVPSFTDDGGSSSAEEQNQKQAIVVTTTKQSFDASNCQAAIVGLHPSVEPVKPDPGDYSYSGMHDHGQLPPPKEGGQFAQIIGFVNAAKNASDAYLSGVIEKEKADVPLVTSDSMKQHNKRKKLQ